MLLNCKQVDETLLIGKWQATEIVEGGELLDIDYSPVNFEFNQQGQYVFNSTIDYKESGRYYVMKELLFTLDTLNKASSEKAVEVSTLTTDSLVLKMMANGKDKIMRLYRIQ